MEHDIDNTGLFLKHQLPFFPTPLYSPQNNTRLTQFALQLHLSESCNSLGYAQQEPFQRTSEPDMKI